MPSEVSRRAMSDGLVAAVDLGASSGRVMLGRVDDGRVSLEEVHRFVNEPVQLSQALYWDALRLHHEILTGLRRATRVAPGLRSIGIDTWGVDVGLLDADGALVGNPVHHRDPRNLPAVERVHARIPQAELYARTGLQFMPINTIYQLEAARITPSFSAVRRVLPLPDLLGYWLTGVVVAERTHASTSGLLDPRTGEWATDLVARLGLDPALLPPLADPGTVRGAVLAAVRQATGLAPDTVVTLVGSHDTASAVVGVPATSANVAYISSGTWSLVGVEAPSPILTEASRQANFTNEGGVDGTIRFLRNVTGLWLLQESLRTWERAGSPEDLPPLIEAAGALAAGGPVFDPQDDSFLATGDMPARIMAWLAAAGRPVPDGRPALVRCILDSLAAEYARTIDDVARLTGRPIEVIHVVGGGSQNALLCQLTADATGRPVVAGPVEATAIGNILVQARTLGLVHGGLQELRQIVRESERLQRYEPATGRA
jgi:rhamnulokinase